MSAYAINENPEHLFSVKKYSTSPPPQLLINKCKEFSLWMYMFLKKIRLLQASFTRVEEKQKLVAHPCV